MLLYVFLLLVLPSVSLSPKLASVCVVNNSIHTDRSNSVCLSICWPAYFSRQFAPFAATQSNAAAAITSSTHTKPAARSSTFCRMRKWEPQLAKFAYKLPIQSHLSSIPQICNLLSVCRTYRGRKYCVCVCVCECNVDCTCV